MARTRQITADFTENIEYFETPGGDSHSYTEASGPYEYLLGALAGCFFYTLSSYERKCSWKRIRIIASGIKREQIPTTLRETEIRIIGYGIDDRSDFERLVEKARKDCSIYNTINKVSNITCKIEYEEDQI